MSVDRLLLVRHATTGETRRAAFPSASGASSLPPGPGLDRAGRAAAAGLRTLVGSPDRAWSSLARRCLETAEVLGLEAVADPDLAECDFGRWAGRDPQDVAREEGEALAAWYADPGCAPHGGESLREVRLRAQRVLERARALPGTTVAVTSGGLVKAALLEVLGLPDAILWRLDAAPASVTELHPAPTGWRLVRLNWTPAPGPDAAAAGVGADGAPAVAGRARSGVPAATPLPASAATGHGGGA